MFLLKDFIMSKLAELQAETREIIEDLLNDGSDPNALYIIEHHIAHYDFDLLEKIAVDAFKAGYEVSEAEEFKDDDGSPIFCFDIISEVELKAEIIDAQQKKILPLLEKHKGIYDGWGTYFENPNADHDEYGDDVEFFDDDDDEYGDDVEFFDDDDDEYGDDGEFFDDDEEEETRVH
ncbi:regulator of ribonuclease activity B [Haemophilus influenzae KR494]|nr:regulator of ribonuclease activity B [Haemophilus influenzae KR494]